MGKYVLNKRVVKKSFPFLLVVVLSFSLIASLLATTPDDTEALSGSQFNAGRIIDDAIFYNGNAMSATSIQNFLENKVPTCDTNGSQIYSGSTTRAQYGTSRGYPPPYTCLKDYRQNTPAKGGVSGQCSPLSAKSDRAASRIIDDVARACSVSQKVLIVLLQKEQSLVTDDWPWSIQYRSATGYGCPDTAPCDSEYYGFFNQVYNAALAYKRYRANPTNYNYRAGRNNTILWHPNAACGTSNVFIHNQATAGLYIYTPYRPNAAALNNLYGTGDGCSSYGNRNFWRMYNDWFGSTYYHSYAAEMIENKLYSDSARTVEVTPGSPIRSGETLYATIKAKNVGGITWKNTFVRVGTRSPSNHSSVFANDTWISNARPAAMKESTITPGQTATFEFTLTTPNVDKVYLDQFQLVAEGRKWMDYKSRFDISVNVRNQYNAQILEKRAYADSGFTEKIGNTVKSGDKIYWRIRAKNIGTLTWDNTIVKVGTASPFNRASELEDPAWPSANRPTLLKESSVAPGQVGTFEYATLGTGAEEIQNEAFSLLAEGIAWMPNAKYADNIKIANPLDRLLPGELLMSGTELRSGGYRLVMQSDGTLVIYNDEGKAEWHLGTPGKRLVMQGDGNLVLYNSSNKAVWSSGTKGGNRFIMQGDGNLVLYNSSNKAVWSSGAN